MGRKQVVEVACSRCERVEHRTEGSTEKLPNVLEVRFQPDAPGVDDLVVKFEDLCTPCMRTVRALAEQMGKRIEGVSPDRVSKAKEEKSSTATSSPATPSSVAKKTGATPNGAAPAHPHSAATAAKSAPARS